MHPPPHLTGDEEHAAPPGAPRCMEPQFPGAPDQRRTDSQKFSVKNKK